MTATHMQSTGRIHCCRSCGSVRLVGVLDLGCSPLADRLIRERAEAAPSYPLNLVFCEDCSLLQIDYTVPPEELFCNDYPYFSSVSDALQRHTRSNVAELIATRGLDTESRVLELASNDGYLLRHYLAEGIPVLGIDPAEGPARAAQALGVETLVDFFSESLATELAGSGFAADVVHANNVLAHVADTNGFIKALATLLKPDGVAVLEFPYVRDLIDHCEFDTVYHQHLCYFSLTSVSRLFARHGLAIHEVRRLPIHGGSLRIYVSKTVEGDGPAHPSVAALLEEEAAIGVTRLAYYRDFGARVGVLKDKLLRLLGELKASGARIAGYGAPAKGCTLLNFCGIDADLVPYTVDRNAFKHGWFMPGTGQAIFAPSRLLEDAPNYVLMLPWNFEAEILSQQTEFRERGGQFIVPVPEPRVV